MKVLLVGNVANNSYNNAKLLRKKGICADVLCYNYTHVMSQPEWEDADFDGGVDQNFPDWGRVDLKGFERPGWFMQKTLVPAIPYKHRVIVTLVVFIAALMRSLRIKGAPAGMVSGIYRFYRKSGLSPKLPQFLKNMLRPFFYYARYGGFDKKSLLFFDPRAELDDLTKEEKILREFKNSFPERGDCLTERDLLPYLSMLARFRGI